MNNDHFQRIEQARSTIPRTLMLVGEDKSASWQYRVAWPCTFLSNHGYVADWCLGKDINGLLGLVEAGRYNVVLTSRAHWTTSEEADNWVKVMRSYGLAWTYEMDDDGWSPGINERQARLYSTEWNKGTERLEFERSQRIELIQRTDGIVVSSPRLAKVAEGFSERPVWCVPNMVDTNWFSARLADAKRIIPPLTIGWSGGTRDEADLESVATAWGRIAQRYTDVRFVVQGHPLRNLINAVPPDRLTQLNWISLPDYPRALLNIDIMMCAVAPNVGFNSSKTAIKWYESSLAGCTCVVSESVYGAEVQDGKDALVAETPDQWENAISRLIEDRNLRRKLQRNAKRQVEANHALSTGWTQWVEALSNVLHYYQSQHSSNGLVKEIVSV